MRKLLGVLLTVFIGLLLSLIIVVGRWLQEDHGRFFLIGLDGLLWWIGSAAACLILFAVVVSYCKLSWRSILGVVGGMALCLYLGSFVVRIESFNGDRTPRWSWRWSPTAEQKLKTYLASKRTTRPVELESIPNLGPSFPGLLGPKRNGIIDSSQIGSLASAPPKLLWRHPVGTGWSSFAITDQMAINLEQRKEEECIVCYDLQSGAEIWCHAEKARFRNQYGDGPRTTPCIDQQRVVCFGATGILTCLNLIDGELLWKQAVFHDPDRQNLLFGMSGSPIVYQGRVYVTPGAGPGEAAMCFDLISGTRLWSNGNDEASYASPTIAQVCGLEVLLSFNGEGLRAYGLDGTELWLHPWVTQGESRVNVAQPIVLESNSNALNATQIVISSGYDKGTALFEVTHENGHWETKTIWESHQIKSKLSNLVCSGNHLYGLDNGLLTCIGLTDGHRTWKKGRYGHGKILLVSGKLMIQAESGEIIFVEANPQEHIELARFPALDEKTWNYPAIAGNRLLVRNDREAAAYELP